MPALDGTGPKGQGSRTGRGLGPCGGGMGRGRGQGRGFGRDFCRWAGNGFGGRNISAEEEKEILKQDIKDTEEYLKSAKKRLGDLDSK